MWDQVFTVFKGFFTSGFWLGSFMPVALAALLHLLIAGFLYPGSVHLFTWALLPKDIVTLLPLVASGLVVLAYALTPLIPMFRGWLDGAHLPAKLYEALRLARRRDKSLHQDDITERLRTEEFWERLRPQLEAKLFEPRKQGNTGAAITDPVVIEHCAALLSALERRADDGKIISADEATEAADALAAALAKNATSLPIGHADHAAALELDHLQTRMIRLFGTIISDARGRRNAAVSRAAAKGASDASEISDPEYESATRAGAARLLTERYSLRVYDVDFEDLWPRLQAVIPKEATLVDRLSRSTSQVDFAVLTLVLTMTVPLVWLPLLALTGRSPWPFLTIGIASPFVARFLYEIVVRSYVELGLVIKAVIDQYRLNVLTTIHRQPLPQSRQAERELWRRIRISEQWAGNADLPYRHPINK